MTITVYTKPACPQCITTKRWLAKRGIDHLTVDITASPAAHDLIVNELGYRAAPVVALTNDAGRLVGHWSGFRPDKIEELAQAHAVAVA